MILGSQERYDSLIEKSQRFEYLMLSRFSIFPERSYRAFEEFRMPDGEIVRLTHHVFGYIIPEANTDEIEDKLYGQLWKLVKDAYPPGTFLMWRRFPEVIEHVDFENGNHIKTKISIRIGSFIPPRVDSVKEGEMYPELPK